MKPSDLFAQRPYLVHPRKVRPSDCGRVVHLDTIKNWQSTKVIGDGRDHERDDISRVGGELLMAVEAGTDPRKEDIARDLLELLRRAVS